MPSQVRPRRVPYVIACKGRPAGDLPAFVQEAQAGGWEVCVVATPSALKFLDLAQLVRLQAARRTRCTPIRRYDRGLGLFNEALGVGRPVVAAPFPNIALTQHPAFRRSMRELEGWGVRRLFDPAAYPLPNLGPASRDLYPWQALREELAKLTAQLGPSCCDQIAKRPARGSVR